LKFIVALALAIPTYGISIVVLIVYLILQTGRFKRNFEKSVALLAEEQHFQGTAIRGISYTQVIAYASERGELIEQIGTNVRFLLNLNGHIYSVSASPEPGSTDAILHARDVSWLNDLSAWLRAHGFADDYRSYSEVYKIEEFICNACNLDYGYEQPEKDVSRIPAQLCFLPNLNSLCFSVNNLIEIPPEIGQLSRLRRLYLDCNSLRSIPPQIGNLACLEVLHVNDNQLTHVPNEVGETSNLSSLNLARNKLKCLPKEIGNLASLKYLHLESNELTALPDSFIGLKKVLYMHLQDNKLRRLPDRLGESGSIMQLYLHDNLLEEVPEQLANIKSFFELTLHGNPLKSLPSKVVDLQVHTLLTIGHQPGLKLTSGQKEWLLGLESKGCKVWVEADGLHLGEASYWKGNINLNSSEVAHDSNLEEVLL